MQNPVYAEYEILEVTRTPNGRLIDSVVVFSHSRYIPGRDYRFSRALIFNRIQDNEPFFIIRNGNRNNLQIITVNGEKYLRTDQILTPADFIDL